MKKVVYKNSLIFVTLILFLFSANHLFAYSGGDGSLGNPYQIATAADLMELSSTQAHWSSNFILTADIDMAGQTFYPIGYDTNPFGGSFDGDLHVIKNLTVSATPRHLDGTPEGKNAGLGLFGKGWPTIKDLGMVNIQINYAWNRVGAFVGDMQGGSITNCFTEGGLVKGGGWVGSFVGASWSTNATITKCYSSTDVQGGWGHSGIAGDVQGTGTLAINKVVYIGTTNGEAIARNTSGSGTVTSTYFKSSSASGTSGTGLTDVQLPVQGSYGGLDFTNTWQMGGNCAVLRFPYFEGYSGGTGALSNPFQIAIADDLVALSSNTSDWDKHFILTDDIDMSGKTFTPIGFGNDPSNHFKGSFNGDGHIISNLTVSDADGGDGAEGIGLFGHTNGATITNLGMVNINVNFPGDERVAGIAGMAEGGLISNCFVENGSINGKYRVGGIVGWANNACLVSDCFANLDLSVAPGQAWYYVGGISGISQNGSNITDCAFYGSLGTTGNRGGICGNLNSSTITTSYFSDAAGDTRAYAGATALDLNQLKQQSNYVDFNFPSPWIMTGSYAVLDFDYFYNYGGLGTESDPFEINSAADLVDLSNNKDIWASGGYFKVTDNIDMAGQTFHPIGYSDGTTEMTFSGTFDGNNKKISNLTVTPHTGQNVTSMGLFGKIENATVKNVGLHDITIAAKTTHERVGGIAGEVFENGEVSNCYILGGTVAGKGRVGGIIGAMHSGTARNCFVKASVENTWGTAGGIVGQLGWGTTTPEASLSEVVFYGKVLGGGNGVIGKVEAFPTISNAYYADGAITNDDPNAIRRKELELLVNTNYVGFDFSGTWAMKSAGYAYLSSFPAENFATLLYDGPNNAPTADAGVDQPCNEYTTITLDGSGSSDPDPNQNMYYTWEVPNGFEIDDATAEKPEVTVPGCNATTSYEIYLRVSDAIATSEWDTMKVTINDTGNVPPNIVDGLEVGLGNSLYTLGLGNIYDPDGDNLSFTWTAPAGIILDDIHAANPTFQAPFVGNSDIVLVFTVEVSDGEFSGTATRTVRLQQFASVPFNPIYVLVLFGLLAGTTVLRKRLF